MQNLIFKFLMMMIRNYGNNIIYLIFKYLIKKIYI